MVTPRRLFYFGDPPLLAGSFATLPSLTLSAVSTTGVVGTPGSATITNNGAIACAWTASLTNGGTVTPSSGTLAAGASLGVTLSYIAAVTHTLTVVNGSGGAVSGNGASITVSAANATTATLNLSNTGTTGSPTTGSVSLNGVAPSAGSVSFAGVGGTFVPLSLSWAAGESGAAKAFTVQRAADGTTVASITNTMGLTNSAAISYISSALAPTDSIAMRVRTSWAGSKPWTAGMLLGPGEIPSAQTVGNAGGTIQVDVRNRHPDGSLRYAVLSGITTAADTVMLRTGLAASGSNVAEPTTAAVVSFTSVVDAASAAVAGGSFTADIATARTNGAGAWSRTTARKVREILGPVMSEFHYFVPTTDAHTSVWFYVRAYSSGDVEVETAVENGWWMVASPGRRNYTATVTIAGSTRYTGTGLAQYHHTRWSRVDWAGADPATVVSQDTDHLQSVRGLPTLAVAALDAACYTTMPQTGATKYASWTRALAEQPTPFTLANMPNDMGLGGYNDNVNIFAPWEMAYLVDGDLRALYAILGNTRAGGYFCTHYRDEATGRPVTPSTYPTQNIADVSGGIAYLAGNGSGGVTPSPTGGETVTTFFHTHAPRLGDVAYILTGRWTALEECQFISATCGLTASTVWSYGGFRIPRGSLQQREIAWMWRDMVAAAGISPQYLAGTAVTGSESSQRAEHVGMVDATIGYYHDSLVGNVAVATPSNATVRANWLNNPFGLWGVPVDQDAAPNGFWGQGGMMNHYLAATACWVAVAGASVAQSAKLLELAAFSARFPVGLLGAAPGSTLWDWRMHTMYNLPFGAGGNPDYLTGPYASWDAVWTHITNPANITWTLGQNPSAIVADNYLYRMGDYGGSPVSTSRMVTLAGDGVPTNSASDVDAACMAVAWMLDLSKLTTVSGADAAAGHYYGSDTWAASIYEGAFRTYPGFAYKPKDASMVSYAMPKRGQAVAFTTNTASSVIPSGWNGTNWLASWFGTFGGPAFVPTYSKVGGVGFALPGGHADFGYRGQMVLNLSSGAWERLLATNAGVTDSLGTPPALGDTGGTPGYELNGTTGMPAEGHPYGNLCFSPGGATGKLIYPVRSAVTTAAVGSPVAYEGNLATGLYTRMTATPIASNRNTDEGRCVWHPALNRWWIVPVDLTQPANNIGYLDRATYTYGNSSPNYTSSPSGALIGGVGATMRHNSYLLRNKGDALAIFNTAIPADGWQAVTVSGGALPGAKNDWARHTDGNWYAFDGDADSTTLIKFVVDPVARTATRSTVTLSTGTLEARSHSGAHYRRLLASQATGSLVWIPGGTKSAAHVRP